MGEEVGALPVNIGVNQSMFLIGVSDIKKKCVIFVFDMLGMYVVEIATGTCMWWRYRM